MTSTPTNEHTTAEQPTPGVGTPIMCSVCAGEGIPVSGRPCVCGGHGTQEAEMNGIRNLLYDAENERDALLELCVAIRFHLKTQYEFDKRWALRPTTVLDYDLWDRLLKATEGR